MSLQDSSTQDTKSAPEDATSKRRGQAAAFDVLHTAKDTIIFSGASFKRAVCKGASKTWAIVKRAVRFTNWGYPLKLACLLMKMSEHDLYSEHADFLPSAGDDC